jgi:putative holliday junction resolvase
LALHRNLEAFLADLPPAGRTRPGLLALDVSRRAIGVAGADPSWQLATPLATLRRKRWSGDLDALKRIVAEREAGALVVGWPLNMDGSEGPRCQSVGAFARGLDAALALPILLWDERLSTFAAEEAVEASGRRGRPPKEGLDALAAAAILQGLLDAVRREGRLGEP